MASKNSRFRAARRLALGCFLCVGGFAAGAAAQELNDRTQSAPEADAKMNRVLSHSAIEENTKQGLVPQDVINNTCGPLQIGNTQTSRNQPLNQDNTVVIRGNVVNVCH